MLIRKSPPFLGEACKLPIIPTNINTLGPVVLVSSLLVQLLPPPHAWPKRSAAREVSGILRRMAPAPAKLPRPTPPPIRFPRWPREGRAAEDCGRTGAVALPRVLRREGQDRHGRRIHRLLRAVAEPLRAHVPLDRGLQAADGPPPGEQRGRSGPDPRAVADDGAAEAGDEPGREGADADDGDCPGERGCSAIAGLGEEDGEVEERRDIEPGRGHRDREGGHAPGPGARRRPPRVDGEEGRRGSDSGPDSEVPCGGC